MKHYFGIIQIAILSLVGKGVCLSQTESYFEGVVYSKCIAVDAHGKELPFPWDKSVEYYDKHRIIIRITEDTQSESSDVCLDSKKRGLYKINHDYSTVTRLADREAKDIPVLEFKKIGEEKLLGYKCDVYFLKYIDRLEFVNEVIGPTSPDTLSCTYYIAQELKIYKPDVLAKLQGNGNTKLLDGRFTGVTLKVVQRHTTGESLIIETTKLERMDVQEIMKSLLYNNE